MSHFQQEKFVEIASEYLNLTYSKKVFELGSYDINGSIKPLFSFNEYIGVDVSEGPNVDKVYDGVLKRVVEITKGKWYKIYVTGHSLGGASALICTNRFEEEQFVVKACYTFGAPRPGGWKYANSFKTNVFRVRNNNDLVTKVPPTIIGYKHVGELCYIDRHGILRTGKVKWYVLFRNWIKGQFERFGDGLRDHSIGEYYNNLKKATRIHK